jgi:predicted transposase/invertase (TIGR01784 family)
MCTYSQGVYNRGIDKGINETKCTIAKNMYSDGFNLAYILKLTGLSKETLLDILKS